MIVRPSLCMEDLESLQASSFELMLTESSLVGKEDRYASPMRNLVLDRRGSNYVVPAVLSYISSNRKKNEGERWNGDPYL